MSGTRILIIVAVGVLVALTAVQWIGQADPVPPKETGELRPLKRFERFTVYNESPAPVVLAHLEFHVDGSPVRDLAGVTIPPRTAWDISPSETGKILRVRLLYGAAGARKWLEIKPHSGFDLTSAGATITGPNWNDVSRAGTEIKEQEADFPPAQDE